MIGTISIEDVVKGVVVNGENVVDYDGIAKIIIPDPPEVPVKDVKVDGESVVNPQGDANIVIPVKDVKVDGESVIDSEGIANITIPDPPEAPVKDVKVNGESVVNAQGVADVDVPVISNLRVVKQLPGVPAAVVTVSDAEAFTMPSLKIAIEPQQEGSGDPSPTNVRPISGWDRVNVTVADDVENPTLSNVYTIDLDGTRYGGVVDVVNGTMTVDRVKLTNDYLINTATYESAGRGCFLLIGITLKSMSSDVVDTKLMASALKTSSQNDLYTNRKIGIAHWWNTRIGFSTGDETITKVSAFKQWLADNGSDVCYELTTPLTIQLTPTAVKSLKGVNNIFADSGDVMQGEYASNIKVVDIG